jgi:Na+-transporting NADH:ubiquinone oxidoreductase subunit B
MLRKIMDYQLSFVEKGKPLHFLRPLVTAGDTFLYEAPLVTKKGPHIRDAIDIKRWMIMVVVALIPCILMAFWNTGLQKFVYSSGDFNLMNEYLASTGSFNDYFAFAGKNNRWLTILKDGFLTVFPIILISYAVGGLWEALFACVRGHEISEGFLVTGILYAIILPPTIPWWMVTVGVSVGVVFSKEVFGGAGMNIVNPALACRAFLFFSYPGKMSGNVWVGSNPATVRESLLKMNQDAGTGPLDGYTQATKLAQFNVAPEINRIHVDAIASNNLGDQVGTYETIQKQFTQWNAASNQQATLGELTQDQMQNFVTSPLGEGGLGLSPGYYEDAYHFSSLNYGFGHDNDWSFFFGDMLGSMGSTSAFACLLGALFLVWTGIGSWRTMTAMGLGAFLTALLFQLGSTYLAADNGAWTPAQFGFPAYKHLLLGGLAFGMVFMATDPVSSPDMHAAKWMYGIFCGIVTVVIRVVNPAFPEGVMLAILMGNVFAPLFDYYAAIYYRKRRTRRVRTATA